MPKFKYSDIDIFNAVKESSCVSDVMRFLGVPMTSGGCHKNISRRLLKLGIAKKDFGKAVERPLRRRNSIDIFRIRAPQEGRDRRLGFAMIKNGFYPICSICGIDNWLDNYLRLEVDHVDGNPLNNLIGNLRFLCPNCHSQTETFVNKRRDAELSKRGPVNPVTVKVAGLNPASPTMGI